MATIHPHRHAKRTAANSIISSDTISASMTTVHRRIVGKSGAHPIAPAASTSQSSRAIVGRARKAEAFRPASASRNSSAPPSVSLRKTTQPTITTTMR